MKKDIYEVVAVLAIFFIFIFIHQCNETNKYKKLYSKELQNVEAYRVDNSNLQGSVRQYQMTMNDLRISQDSLDKKLLTIIDELKLKDKQIEYLEYQSAIIHKVDTIQLSDTIFLPNVDIDTIIKDAWYKLELGLHYPAEINISPTFNSEKYIVVNSKKEYNKPKSKFFFIRWFQKKHQVIEVNIEEKSPYITNKKQKFIKILK